MVQFEDKDAEIGTGYWFGLGIDLGVGAVGWAAHAWLEDKCELEDPAYISPTTLDATQWVF